MNEQEERIERATAMSRALQVINVSAEHGQPGSDRLYSFDTTTKAGLMQLERHECDAQDNGVKFVNTVLEIIAFSCQVVHLPDDAGEVKPVPLLTLELKDGNLVNLFSAPAVRCFASRLRTHAADGPLSAKHPLKLKLVNRETDGARKMYWLDRPA